MPVDAEIRTVPANPREMVKLYGDFVRKRVYRLNRGQVPPGEMEDIVQGVWCRLLEYKALEKYQPEKATFPAFLNTAVYNASWNLRRSRKRRAAEKLMDPPRTSGGESIDQTAYEDNLLTDHGRSATKSSDTVDLQVLDQRLSSHLSTTERQIIYEALQSEQDLTGALMSLQLDPEMIETIWEEIF